MGLAGEGGMTGARGLGVVAIMQRLMPRFVDDVKNVRREFFIPSVWQRRRDAFVNSSIFLRDYERPSDLLEGMSGKEYSVERVQRSETFRLRSKKSRFKNAVTIHARTKFC